jgi:hypothetical protein
LWGAFVIPSTNKQSSFAANNDGGKKDFLVRQLNAANDRSGEAAQGR